MIDSQNIKKFKEGKKNIFIAFIIVVMVFLISLIVWVNIDIQNKIKEGKYIGQEIESKNTIIVSEKGEIYAKPDLTLTDFSVITEDKQVSQAMSKNSQKMNAIIDFIKNQGVEDKDLKTTAFNIYPRYEWYRETEIYPQGRRVLVGYEVHQTLQVKIRDMEKIGDIIEGAVEKGANQVGDLQFVIDKEDELKKQAREEAITKAKNKAEELAGQLGVNLVRITNFSESSLLPRFYGLEKAAAEGLGGGGLEIETGENKIEVTVTITYEIN